MNLTNYQELKFGDKIEKGDIVHVSNSMLSSYYSITRVSATMAFFKVTETYECKLKRTYTGEYMKAIGAAWNSTTYHKIYRKIN